MKEPVPPFDHKEAIKKIAAKHGYEERVVNNIVNMFFSAWGIIYFIRRFQLPYIPKVFTFKATWFTYKARNSETAKKELTCCRMHDTVNGRPTDY